MKNKIKEVLLNNNKKNNFSTLKNAIKNKNVTQIREVANYFNETDMANFMEKMNLKQQIFLLRSLDNLTASEVFNHLSIETTTEIIEAFSKKETRDIISPLYSDDVVELIEELPQKLIIKILESTSKEQRKDINYILNYQEETVGYEMNVDFIPVKINDKVSEVIDKINKPKKKIDEDVEHFYVVDEKGVLIGYIPWKKLLQANIKNKLIAEICETNVISVRAFDTKEIAAKKILKYELTQLPVVDGKNKLVGILTNEEALQLVKEEFSDDINKQAGIIESSDKKYFEISIWQTFKSRMPWLLITISITTLSQLIFTLLLKDFNENNVKLEWFKFVLPFLPFMLTIVGNVALQSTSMIVKGLTLSEIQNSKLRKVLNKELSVAFLIMMTVWTINIPRTFLIEFLLNQKIQWDQAKFWKNLLNVNVIIFFAIFFSILVSSSLPILANRLGYDPALMSSPLLTTIVDLFVTGVAVGFSYLLYTNI